MNYFELYPGDYLRDTTRLTLVEHGAYLRLLMAYYAEETPLPADYAELYVIVSAVSAADKAAVRKVADRFFAVGDDGLRRNGRADDEIAKAADRMEGAEARKSNDAVRKQRSREYRATLFAELREVGIVPDGTIPMAELKAIHAQHVTRNSHVTYGVTRRDKSRDVTRDNTGNQTPHAIHHLSVGKAEAHTNVTTPREPTGSGVCDPPIEPSPVAQASIALRQRGLRITPQHPDLIAAVGEGVTVAALEAMAELYPGKPAGYVIAAARRQHAEGATPIATRPPRNDQPRSTPSKTFLGLQALQELGNGNPRLDSPRDHPGLDAPRDAQP